MRKENHQSLRTETEPYSLEGRILTSSETRDLLAAKTSAFKFKERQTSNVDREAT